MFEILKVAKALNNGDPQYRVTGCIDNLEELYSTMTVVVMTLKEEYEVTKDEANELFLSVIERAYEEE